MIPWIGYAPDVDPVTPGVMVDCDHVIPTARAFEAAPSPASSGYTALAATCMGASLLRKTDDTVRLFAGTSANLYEGQSNAWTNRTPAATLTGLGSADRWRFAQMGDTSFAVAKTEKLHFLAGASTFAQTTSTAPKAGVIETVNNFVMLFDVVDQGALYDSATRADGWWCGPKGGYIDFTPSVTSEAATGVLQSTPGKITAGRRFGYQCVAYKLRSMYLGTYVGQPVIWDWQLIPGDAGALSQEAVVNIGTPEQPVHLSMGADNFYAYAGARAMPIGDAVKETVFGELNMAHYYSACALHDRARNIVRFWYPVVGTNLPEKCIVFNYKTGKWGRDDRQIEMAVDFSAGGTTYDALGTSYATYDDLPALPYDLAFSVASAELPAVFDTAHLLKTLTGAAGASSITTGDYGDEQIFSTLARVRPRFLSAPAAASFANYYRDVLSDALTADATTPIAEGRFDMLRSARWHRGVLQMEGDWEMPGIDATLIPDGEE